MRPRNFALVVGGAVLAAFMLSMVLPSCGAPDCPCDFPSLDGGADGEAGDWFDVYYSECVGLCAAAEEWAGGCWHPPMVEDCIGFLWGNWVSPLRCEAAAGCYRALRAAGDCQEREARYMEEHWNPAIFNPNGGCPVDVP